MTNTEKILALCNARIYFEEPQPATVQESCFGSGPHDVGRGMCQVMTYIVYEFQESANWEFRELFAQMQYRYHRKPNTYRPLGYWYPNDDAGAKLRIKHIDKEIKRLNKLP